MNQKTLDEFRNYLVSRNRSDGSITGYVRTISDLSESPDGMDPAALLGFVDDASDLRKRN